MSYFLLSSHDYIKDNLLLPISQFNTSLHLQNDLEINIAGNRP
ncbi:MAG: hypothetical protein ACQES9_03890 [Myxococcota bacterium]